MDHFYSKSHYPILAASFYNLIPVCATCNLLKSANDFSYYPHINDDELLRFSFTINRADFYKSKDFIAIVVHLTDETYRSQVEKLKLEKEHRNDRPLSKLTQDILEEIENL